MSAPFWIEILDKAGAVASRQRFQAESVSVGRGYGNDVVVDDPFVAPTHLRVSYDADGALWIEDLATANGTFDTRRQVNVARLPVDGEASILVGHTGLRVRAATYPVTAALPLPARRAPRPAPRHAQAAMLMLAIFIALETLSTWLAQTSEFKLAVYLLGGVLFPVMVFVWAGMWALVTRIVTAHGEYFRHVAIAFAILLAVFAIDIAADFISYAFAWSTLQKWMPAFGWVVLGALFFAHFQVISARHRRLAGAIIGAFVAIAVGVHIWLRAESDRVQTQRISAKLMPPFLLLKSPVAPEIFFKDALALKPKLEEERKKEPSSGGLSMADFD